MRKRGKNWKLYGFIDFLWAVLCCKKCKNALRGYCKRERERDELVEDLPVRNAHFITPIRIFITSDFYCEMCLATFSLNSRFSSALLVILTEKSSPLSRVF